MWLSEQQCTGLLGREKTEKLLQYVGGGTVYIPTQPNVKHALAEVIGVGKMALLCREFGGEYLHLPLTARKTRRDIILENLDNGMTIKEIAALANTSLRYVYQVAAQVKEPTETKGRRG